MAKKYFLINTAQVDFKANLNPGVDPTRHLFLSTNASFAVERIDVHWKSSSNHEMNNSITINMYPLGDGPDREGPDVGITLPKYEPRELQCVDVNPTPPSFDVLPSVGFADLPLDGPWVFSPAPGGSTYSVDFTAFGGYQFDAKSDAAWLDILWTTHDIANTADDYRLVVIVSQNA